MEKVYNFLGQHGFVSNIDDCIRVIQTESGEEVDIKYINSYAEKNSGCIRYFDENIIELRDEESIKFAKYKWVDIGYKSGKYSLYASFYRKSMNWEGAYIGTEQMLRGKLGKYKYKPNIIVFDKSVELVEDNDLKCNITEEEYNNLSKNAFCVELYKRLLMKEYWATSKNGKNRLLKYMEAVGDRVVYNINNNIKQGYALNKNQDRVLINTGLIDKYMNDIYVVFKYEKGFLSNPSIINTRVTLINMEFSREDVAVLPGVVKFYTDVSQLVFNGTSEDFDLCDSRRLHHIVTERNGRFPDNLNKLNTDVLCSKIKDAILRAIKLAERDYRYIVPMYNTNEHEIQFLMPLHIDRSIDCVPELVLVVGRLKDFYTIMTILDPDDAYDNARLLSRPDNSWLRPEVGDR